MKRFIVAGILSCMTSVVFAQSRDKVSERTCVNYFIDGVRLDHLDGSTGVSCYAPIVVIRIEPITFNSRQLLRLPQRNINAIAGLVAGVDSRGGQVPNIRGAEQEGTAYFVDGIRVRSECVLTY